MSQLQSLNPVLVSVTDRIRQRSLPTRTAYLQRLKAQAARTRGVQRMGCSNLAHVVAPLPKADKWRLVQEKAPHIGVVSAYNDMLSAHQPYEGYPAQIRQWAREMGATVQVAGGVPAMCDGITQGMPGMELSLFSRDTIAMATAVGLSHDVFDAVLLLGVCDKIVPGLLIGALQFGHLPCVFVPAGPMSSGISNAEKAKVREAYARGEVGRDELFASESAAYHSPGTCTFYGTANSNQMLLEAMGLHVPGAAFAPPDSGMRTAMTREAVALALKAATPGAQKPIGELVDERCIVNAMVALLATGGSTNHLIHWVAVARAAGIVIDWSDFSELSSVTPLLTRVYPNGQADVNQFQEAGGPAWVLRELWNNGGMHRDAMTVSPSGGQTYTQLPRLDGERLSWQDGPMQSPDRSIVRSFNEAFSATGGLSLLQGNLGRAVIKVSAVPEDRHVIEAPARVFESQEAMLAAFEAGELERDVVVVVRFQGPQANGMPELHKLTPPLAVLQGRGFRVALVTDGRMSGASGKVPAAIHITPEALAGGPLSLVQDGDLLRLDATQGVLQCLVADEDWRARVPAQRSAQHEADSAFGCGRELFANVRRYVRSAEEGAVTWC